MPLIPLLSGGPPPANDDFVNAITLTGSSGVEAAVWMQFATTEVGEPNHLTDDSAPAHSIWWKITPATNQMLNLDTNATSPTFDSVIGVFTGPSVGFLTYVGEDDEGGVSSLSQLTVEVVGGTTYYIRVTGWDGDFGDAVLTWSLAPIPYSGTGLGEWGRWGANAVDPTTEFTTSVIGVGSVLASPTLFLRPGETPPTARFWVVPEVGDPPSAWHELTKVTTCTTQDEISNVGSVAITVQNDDAALAYVTGESMIAVEFYGQVVVAGVVTTEDIIVIDPEGDEARTTTLTMPGAGQLLNEAIITETRGRWADSDAQKPSESVRRFDWTNPAFDTDSWGFADVMAVRQLFGVLPPIYWGRGEGEAWPVGFILPQTCWLWAKPGTSEDAPVGTCLFRQILNLGNAGYIIIMAGFDNIGSLWFDGLPIFTDVSNFRKAQVSEPILIDNGYHVVAAKCTNVPGTPGSNPAGMIWEVWHCDDQGNPSTIYGHSSDDVLMLPYIDEEPGLPIGAIIGKVVQEAQLRGALPGITMAFGDYYDSNGAAWPIVTDVATNVGRTVLDFLRDLSTSYIDWRLDPASLILYVYNRGTMGTDRGLTFHGPTNPDDPSSGNVQQVVHKRVW